MIQFRYLETGLYGVNPKFGIYVLVNIKKVDRGPLDIQNIILAKL